MITEELKQRFFNKQCTDEEAAEVAAWLHAHPEAADEYIKNEEPFSGKQDKQLPEKIKAEAWHHISQNIEKQKRITWLKRNAIAACVAFCMIGVWYFVIKNNSKTSRIDSYKKENTTLLSLTDTEYNYTNTARRILLEDGSAITLSPHSFVWFDTPFSNSKRNVYLQGEARFEVAKNKQKPFTLYAGLFATTALGTEFIVKQQKGNIRVQLLHGKVVIEAINKRLRNWKNIYLLPGEQMIYNDANATARVSHTENKKTIFANPLQAANNTQSETTDSLIFHGTDMLAVLQKLHSYYYVTIQFNPKEIKDMSFTGTIAKKDSVDTILKVITQMNGLTLEKINSSIQISKNKN